MTSELTHRCWKALLLLTRAVEAHAGPVDFCSVQIGKEQEVKINDVFPPSGNTPTVGIYFKSKPPAQLQGDTVFRITRFIEVTQLNGDGLPQEEIRLMATYLPYCFLPVYARRWNRAVAVSHFAQSLDGRIATGSGDSKWIGNEDNRTHAHRMRAICRGVLIGSRTLKRDKPALTVRRVEGPQPRPILLGSTVKETNYLPRNGGPPPLILAPENGPLSPMNVLKSVYEEGISSVYIEGGSATTSRFLKEDAIDIVQVHISPMILGSGVPSFSLPPVQTIREARRFRAFRYEWVGDGVMFVGVPASPGRRFAGA